MDIVTQGDYDDKYKAYYEWHDYNKSFFQSIFTWQTMENDYREIAEAPLGFFGDYTLQNKITDLRINIDIKVKFLTSLLGKIELFEAYEEKVLTMKNIDKTTDRDMSKVFIVHGHDNEAKIEVARFVEKLGFMAIILHEQASENSTIIEKLERNSDVGFGIVVYTPCDKGGKAEDGAIIRPRARQN
ncbi:MAG: nucleotide-binding protein, partial [Alphaproteobacteria bacterium]|nr:nucleotide-binding protein [Alphaproteobacteria bacterium]